MSRETLAPNSPALSEALLADCPPEDQRGVTRDDGDGACDIGAFEGAVEDSTCFVIATTGNTNAVFCL